ncbi:ATP-dependent DNA helicase UvrD2 [Frankia canadensis]|uniref:DNA 3'-5' helicase n=1 Tax=Frankia canadensis TaxID=1836972 RepID=A0A2I2KK63_9ACTN|nr:ATP-dependent DNA helicase UvrD2 [Frankia canadensis]SNQ46037.1 ATP-dependent DNA helicase UvrD2 [Frankia canadensis]SOU53327.1 ATP-dependent DNA helicase UvrD2 [Frankia canadensis]
MSGSPAPTAHSAGSPPSAAPAADDLLGALDPEQRAAAGAPLGPVCILAGAGTGKTRTITHRIAHMVVDRGVGPDQILAVSFTTRAAGELRGRLRSMGVPGVQARTFHSAALRQLHYFWPTVAGGPLPKPESSKIPHMARAASRLRLRAERTELRDLTAEVEWAKATLLSPADYAAAAAASGRETAMPADVIARLYAAYEEVKREAGVLDMEDLLLLTAAMIEEHSWVATELRARYRHFVVDEYQDVNMLQQRVLEAWLGDRDSLCVVGDPHQTIYSFAGASPRYLLDFARRHQAATVVRLVRDYRSTPQVVALANRLVRASPATGLVAVPTPGPAPVWLECDSEPDEAAAVVSRIRTLLNRGTPASRIAVLYRTNAQSEAYEAAIGAGGIAYLVRGGEKFFARAEVVKAMQLLRGAVRSADTDRPEGLADAVADALGALNWNPRTPATGSGAERERWENLAALHRLAEDLAARSPQAGLAEFVAELADRAAHEHLPTVEGVTLSTLHAAKGLEWDAVFLVGLTEGTLPLVHARTPEQVEEERRLLYVGVTRARTHLVLSWSLARAPGGRRVRGPSRFLDDLRPVRGGRPGAGGVSGAGRGLGASGGPGVDGDEGGRSGAAGRSAGRGRSAVRCRVCGCALTGPQARAGHCDGCPVDVDAALYERLRAWRATTARELRLPVFVIYTDATLRAIAESRPASVAELVRIPGIGQAKLDRYGQATLDLVAGRTPRTGPEGTLS